MRILAIPGDGIGTEVVTMALEVMQTVHPDIKIERKNAGYQTWKDTGQAIDDSILSLAYECDGILFGATATPSPPPKGYRSPILAMRKKFGHAANLRYCQSIENGGIDVVIVRESSEGLYAGVEREVLGGFITEHLVTENATRAVALEAATLAKKRKNKVTIVHKANVLKKTEGLFRQISIETLEQEGIQWEEALSDAAGYFLVKEPRRYDVMLMPNHTGDMLSDVAAAVAGSLGLIPSLTIGSKGPPLAEPIHGSAPDLVGKNLADPVATIRSASLLLSYLGEEESAQRIENAVKKHLQNRENNEITASEILKDITTYL